MRAEAEGEYDRRAKRRMSDLADTLVRAYVRDVLTAADEAACATLPRLERAAGRVADTFSNYPT